MFKSTCLKITITPVDSRVRKALNRGYAMMNCPVVNGTNKCSHTLEPVGNKTYKCTSTHKHWLREGIDDKACFLEHFDPESDRIFGKYRVDCSELGEQR